MKKLLLILCAIVILLSGCNSDKTDIVTKSEQDLEGVYIPEEHIEDVQLTNSDDSWKYEVAQKLYEEFCYFYKHMEEDDFIHDIANMYVYNKANNRTGFNRTMAADRACGLLTAYKDYISSEKLDYIKQKTAEINERIDTITMTNFGYSKSGLHFISINYVGTRNTLAQEDMCNKIRGIESECDFLGDFFYSSKLGLIDLYVEDLSPDKGVVSFEFNVTGDRMSKNDDEYKQVFSTGLDGEGVLIKYNRDIVREKKTVFDNQSWNLFAMDGWDFNWFKIMLEDETVVLTYKAPSH